MTAEAMMTEPTTAKPMTVAISRLRADDWPAVWRFLRVICEAGDTLTYAPGSSEDEIRRAWVDAPLATYVARDERDQIVGSYYLKSNQPGLGSHVCNAGYAVAAQAQGRGVAAAMCEHSQREAVRLGFRAMQFNIVVSTNERAVRLWQRLGFAIVGTLPRAFDHTKLGFVDAYVMFKELPGA